MRVAVDKLSAALLSARHLISSMDDFEVPKAENGSSIPSVRAHYTTVYSKFSHKIIELIEDAMNIGIDLRNHGSFKHCKAFSDIRILHNSLMNKLPGDVALYEPVFNEEDIKELGTIGVVAFSGDKVKTIQNEDHSLLTRTLVFMPHCDIELHQKVLADNWSIEGLKRMVLIGNPLNQYSERSAWYTRPLSEANSDDRAFVALAVQYFDQSQVSLEQLLELHGQGLSAMKEREATNGK
ncbi:14610_t:CDS:2 [Acaulospora colombiana]|uniref:14610_t:CDS:1 n=1 Tax=Acaulospora colombiana TaxID=27376 RepID=A0ACA9NEH9_9GLOM|nr:14610_t:CDS:2 [Acaulospora colombiana]